MDELYFILEGFIGIGFSKPFCAITEEPYQMVRTQRGVQTICDHYVINSRMSQWTYIALDQCIGYALKKNFLHGVVFEKFPDFQPVVSSAAFTYYHKWIARTISKERQMMLEQLNRQRAMYNQVTLVDVKTARSPIPTMEEYQFWVREEDRNRKAARLPAEGTEITVGQVEEEAVEKPKDGADGEEMIGKDRPIEEEIPGGSKVMQCDVDDEEVENNFFDRFEEMSDFNIQLNDGIRNFV